MNLKLQTEGRRLTAIITGDIDHHSAVLLREQVDRQIAATRPQEFVIDLAGVTFMDSSGLGFIMGRYKLIAAQGGRIAVTGDSGRISKILEMSGAFKFVEHWEVTK